MTSAELGTRDKAKLDAEVSARFAAAKQAFEANNKDYLAVRAEYDKLGRNYETNVWDDVAIHGIVTFLFTNSAPYAIAEPP